MPEYQLYGITVRSEIALPGVAVQGRAPRVSLVRAAKPPFSPTAATRVYTNATGPISVAGAIEVHRGAGGLALRCVGYVAYFFSEDGRGDVTFVEDPGCAEDVVRAIFLGPVCALLLELGGTACLHASAVALGGRAVAVAGPSGAGKSSLLARLVDLGHPLISDDIVPLRVVGGVAHAVPAFPEVRLFPGAVPESALDGEGRPIGANVRDDGKARIPVGRGWGTFAEAPAPLGAVYLVDRHNDPSRGVESVALSPAEGLIELVRLSFCARSVAALGLESTRLPRLAGLLPPSGVRRLSYPGGWDRLDGVCDALRRDLERQ